LPRTAKKRVDLPNFLDKQAVSEEDDEDGDDVEEMDD